MLLQSLEAWVSNPENELHPNFKDCSDELLLIRTLEGQKHNHCSREAFEEKLSKAPFIVKAAFVGEIAVRLHKKEHGDYKPTVKQVRAYSLDELYNGWVQDHIDDPPEGFDNKCQCENDQELQGKIEESLTLCQSWINSKK